MTAPALSAHRCLTSVYAERLRVVRLHADGSLDPGTENMYVTDALISIGSEPEIEAGEELTQRNGGGAICVTASGDDSIRRFNLTLSLCQLDSELIEMLTGATLIESGGVTVGLQMPRQGDVQPIVCVEAWSQARTASEQASEDGSNLWFHWVWPKVRWTIGGHTLENGILTVPLTGKAEENDSMGLGPAADWPAVITAAEAWFLDDDEPAAVCGYQPLVVAGSAS